MSECLHGIPLYQVCERCSSPAPDDTPPDEAAKLRVLEAAIDDYRSGCTITAHNLTNAVRTLLEIRKAPPK